MNKKIIGILIMIVLIAVAYLPVLESGSIQKNKKINNMLNYEYNKKIIFTNNENDDMLDQNQSDFSGWSWVVLNQGSMLAQSFKPSLNVLTRIEILLIKIGSPYEVTISIRDNLSGADLTSISVLENEIPRIEPKWIEFDFQDIYVEPEQTYYIVWYPIGIDSTNYFGWSYGDYNPYDRGDAYHYFPTNDWEINEGNPNHPNPDYCFKTYGVHNNPPNKPQIIGPNTGKTGTIINYTFYSSDPDGDEIYYCVDWGDGVGEICLGLFPSNTYVNGSHMWDEKGTFTIKVKTEDIHGLISPEATLQLTIPKNKAIRASLFLQRLFQRLPFLNKILNQII
jgi:hypothetical protein